MSTAKLEAITRAAGDTGPSPTADQIDERELRVSIMRDWFVDFTGTASQLVAEELIPDGFEWPHAADHRCWEAKGCTYSLSRVRPDGHKGPMRSWFGLDNWTVRVKPAGRVENWFEHRLLERKAKELMALHYSLTPAGLREREAKRDRYWKTLDDKAFQAFRSIIIPERKRPGRKPSSATKGAQPPSAAQAAEAALSRAGQHQRDGGAA